MGIQLMRTITSIVPIAPNVAIALIVTIAPNVTDAIIVHSA